MLDLEITKKTFPELEEDILKFWKEQRIFEKSIEQNTKPFRFYDGPPFATGLPHYGHILAGTIKDVIPRYKAMCGHRVERKFGWDCHGLPVEYEMEKELSLSGKKDIEKYGVKNFCESCRGIVQRYTSEWEKTVVRMGRWVDFENSYKTMDKDYMESILWVFKSLWDKNLIYEGHKPMHICPRCATTLSNFEVSMGYKDKDDISCIAKFALEGEHNTYILAWTTTPWTLPSNMMLAVGADIDYVKIKKDNETLILAKDLLGNFEKELSKEPEIIEKFKGKSLLGKSYTPLYDCATHLNGKKHQIAIADFVSTEDGTGIVHIAPAFGEDDLKLGEKEGVPFFQPVNIEGTFTDIAPDFLQDREVLEANKDVVRDLKERGLVFQSKSYHHSYPHCWRCDSPLLNFATSSFFVRVEKQKENLIATNKNIHWTPEHLRDGRFGKWLENARDWSISRNRFWGAPIPVWRCDSCDHKEAFGSVREIASRANKKGKIMIARHGEAEHNVKGIVSSNIDSHCPLTEKGKNQAKALANVIKDEKIDMIISSPLQRTRETTEEILKTLPESTKVIYDERIREIETGVKDGCAIEEWQSMFPDLKARFFEAPEGGESKADVENRTKKLLQEIYDKHLDKNILIITHGAVLRVITKFFHNLSIQETFDVPIENAQLNTFSFGSLPTNDFGEIDLHRPYIDDVHMDCPHCKNKMQRVPDVLDCWFESGSMPYAEKHYPFENKDEFIDLFPADFIAEGLDQTRGWFYTLHVLANGLFNQEAYKNVIVNGIVLAEDGQKMSKSKKNYPDPELVFSKLGADSVRFYMMNSPVVRADDMRFSEAGVEETMRKVLLPLKNSYAFFASLSNITKWELKGKKSNSKLDKWILSELRECIKIVQENLDTYNLDHAARAIPEFLEKLTNFYIRRSRRRFWNEENEAFETLYTALLTISKALAPFMPFYTESLYQELSKITPNAKESIHLEQFPNYQNFNDEPELREEIGAIRTIISLGLAIRAKEKIRVRQPLQSLKIALPPRISQDIIMQNANIIKEELNIKEIEILEKPEQIAEKIAKPDARKIGPRLGKEVQKVIQEAKNGNFSEKGDQIKVGDFILNKDEIEIAYLPKEGLSVESANGIVASLETEITKELRNEGIMREIVRHLQDMRKEADYQIADRIKASINGADDIMAVFKDKIAEDVLIDEFADIDKPDQEKQVEIEELKISLKIKK
ncbi:MAG: class I tRNA ligase family protein [Candidatus Gracilibacteria bacterium]|jgi:isoleucyl-tRNA synthetase|nr:class I tRNA ligase family protein [Candidatus Gracilibacteria bacterium]